MRRRLLVRLATREAYCVSQETVGHLGSLKPPLPWSTSRSGHRGVPRCPGLLKRLGYPRGRFVLDLLSRPSVR